MSIVEHIGKHYISRTILIVYQIRRIHQKKDNENFIRNMQ